MKILLKTKNSRKHDDIPFHDTKEVYHHDHGDADKSQNPAT